METNVAGLPWDVKEMRKEMKAHFIAMLQLLCVQ